MIWFSGVEETNQGSEAKYNSPAKAMAQKAMNMRTFEEVEHSGHLTMQNFNRKSEALAASKSQPMRKSFEKSGFHPVTQNSDGMMVISSDKKIAEPYGASPSRIGKTSSLD
mmetsp:Transcript_22097/g.29526  ORF Transcript_22097/g.29526 Transcript_22097/m.29526 type:complete len:111 (+) Transcript_22097:2344-2676(+)